MATIEERVAKIESLLGDTTSRASDDVAKLVAGEKFPELPNGDPAVFQNLHQMREDIRQKNKQIKEMWPRIEALESKPPASTQPPTVDASSVIAALATVGVNIAIDPETKRLYFALGMKPDFDNFAPIQIGGGLAPWIWGYGSTQNVPGQGSGSPDSCSGVKILDGDGGFRVVQYGKQGKKGFIRNTLARRFSVFAMDSNGEYCGEVCEPPNVAGAIPPGAKPENGGGQTWYMKFDFVNKLVRLLTFKPGWAISIERCSTQYANADKKVEPV